MDLNFRQSDFPILTHVSTQAKLDWKKPYDLLTPKLWLYFLEANPILEGGIWYIEYM